jgi:hypothetical protein
MDMMRLLLTITLACLLPIGGLAGPLTPTGETQSYVGIVLHSKHVNPQTLEAESLNDNTPGLTFGRRFQLEMDGTEAFLEAGVFYNSYKEVSPVFLTGYTLRAIDFGGSELRIGAFTGIGYYKELGQVLNKNYGMPFYKGFIPLAGASVIYRIDDHELRMTTVPAEDLDLILNFSYTYAF